MESSLASVVQPPKTPDKGAFRLGRYEIGRELGSGGMGAVVEATHSALGKRVAIKTFHPHLASKSDSLSRFVREGRAIAQLRHPHVVEVYDLDQTEEGVPYLVMELLEGRTLAEHLASTSPLALTDAIAVILPLVSALGAAHAAGIVHRDVKPSNIFLRGGRLADPCLVDFGVSKLAGPMALEELTQSGTLIGSYPYFSPEHTRGGKYVTAQSDLYSLAAVLYECAVGAPPFEADSAYELMHAIATRDVRRPSLARSSLPRELDEVIVRAMDRDPLRRYPTMHAFGSALLGLAGKRTWHVWSEEFATVERDRAALERTATEEAPALPPLPRRTLPRPRVIASALTLVAAFLAAFLFLRPGSGTPSAPRESQAAPESTARPEPEPLPARLPVEELAAGAAKPEGKLDASRPEILAAAPVSPRSPSRPVASARTKSLASAPSSTGTAPEHPERGSNGVPIFE